MSAVHREVRREIVLPAAPGQVWEAITSPEVLREWFGADVAWELTPGGAGRFQEDDGSAREARVGSVEPGRHLGFRWWPEGREDEASDVDFELSEDGDGTRLVVTETPAGAASISGMHSRRQGDISACQNAEWTDCDSRLFRVWAEATSAFAVRG
jgi:uncharacterized protein YndB with AHSA1/START domain